MSAKHTPGPWIIGAPPPNGEQTIGTVSGLMVAVATTGGAMRTGETEANARLIAAAPELAWVLRHALAPYEGKTDKACPNWVKPARAAIAKVVGDRQ